MLGVAILEDLSEGRRKQIATCSIVSENFPERSLQFITFTEGASPHRPWRFETHRGLVRRTPKIIPTRCIALLSIHVMPTMGTTFSYAEPTHHGRTSRRWSPRPCSTERKSWLFVLIGAEPGKLPPGNHFWTA